MRGIESQSLSERIKATALALGFDLVGIAPAEPGRDTEFLREWLGRGHAGEMHYLGRRVEERVDPRNILPEARSVIALGWVYDPGERPAPGPLCGQVARYAGGDDYHEVLIERVRALEDALEVLASKPVRTRGYVDTGPVQERVFAARAGLGWIGRNTCLIHPRLGSYLFLAVVLTDLELPADSREPDHCGSCRACIDACPTDALSDYVMDATLCLSYTTIELGGEIPQSLRTAQGRLIFGCDICQEVCPWNERTRREIPADHVGLRERIRPRPEWVAPTLAWLLQLDEQAWQGATRHTALRRTKYRGLMRNALVAAGNAGDRGLLPLLRHHAASDDAVIALHARWALERLGAG